jgi:NAD(P)-dependent dehydrogenase (short-subunit alcohol dehydrogenase family)
MESDDHSAGRLDPFARFDLRGRTAVVTGGSVGIGYNIARALACSGADVVIAARREEQLRAAADELGSAAGRPVRWLTMDLADPADVTAFVGRANEALGGVDIFVGNAAQIHMEPLESLSDDTMRHMLQVNVMANIALARGFVPHMREQGWGRLLFCSSATSLLGSSNEPVSMYSTVKGAINAFVRAAAAELGRSGITVNAIVLGMFHTAMVDEIVAGLDQTVGPGAGQGFIDGQAAVTAVGRLADCTEVEGVVQLLASDAGSYVTGSNLVLDGGLTIMMRPDRGQDAAPAVHN